MVAIAEFRKSYEMVSSCQARPGNKNTRLTYRIGSESGAATPLPILVLHVIVWNLRPVEPTMILLDVT